MYIYHYIEGYTIERIRLKRLNLYRNYRIQPAYVVLRNCSNTTVYLDESLCVNAPYVCGQDSGYMQTDCRAMHYPPFDVHAATVLSAATSPTLQQRRTASALVTHRLSAIRA